MAFILSGKLDKMISEGVEADGTFVIGGEKIHVIKYVFTSMFKDEWSKGGEVELKDVEYHTMARLVKAVHMGSIYDAIDESELLKLFMVAHQYQVDHVIRLCEDKAKNLRVENEVALDYFIEGKLRSNSVIGKVGLDGLMKNPSFIADKQAERYAELTPDMVEAIMLELASRLSTERAASRDAAAAMVNHGGSPFGRPQAGNRRR